MATVKPERAHLWDMLKAAREIGAFIQGADGTSFEKDLMLRSAVERQFEIMGEAARRISNEFHERHSEIPWSRIIGLRNILAHKYGVVMPARVWGIAIDDLPQVVDDLEKILAAIDSEGAAQ
jgi:uncharacterized protein with HEPN domain